MVRFEVVTNLWGRRNTYYVCAINEEFARMVAPSHYFPIVVEQVNIVPCPNDCSGCEDDFNECEERR